VPERVVWKQSGPVHDRSYWLAQPPGEAANDGLVIAKRDGQVIDITQAEKVGKVLIRLDERMVDLDKPVEVTSAGKSFFRGLAPRTIGTLVKTLAGRGDAALLFDAEVEVTLSPAK
jgi:hypothetical protein